MEIVLKRPEVQRFVDEQIKQGAFASASDLIEIALLRLMMNDTDEEFDDETLKAIQRGDEQIARGEGRDVKEFAREFRAKHAQHLGRNHA